ncbi:MAG TPA: dihydroneopterin aldolase, partial [bacterium]|nr:dihydroneopterin aldolase [bacterium]
MRLLGMAFHAYHGLQQEEIENGQRFEVDVELHFDAAPAGRSDRISDTIDVREIYALVRRVVMERRFFLIEAVA